MGWLGAAMTLIPLLAQAGKFAGPKVTGTKTGQRAMSGLAQAKAHPLAQQAASSKVAETVRKGTEQTKSQFQTGIRSGLAGAKFDNGISPPLLMSAGNLAARGFAAS